jgi:hypothetical protein
MQFCSSDFYVELLKQTPTSLLTITSIYIAYIFRHINKPKSIPHILAILVVINLDGRADGPVVLDGELVMDNINQVAAIIGNVIFGSFN